MGKNVPTYASIPRHFVKTKLDQEAGKCDIPAANKRRKYSLSLKNDPKMPVQQDGKSKCVAKRGDLRDAQIRSKWTENPWMLAVSQEIQKRLKRFRN